MTRKDYIKIARAIKDNTMNDTQPILNKNSFIYDMCAILYEDNNNFDGSRFVEACND